MQCNKYILKLFLFGLSLICIAHGDLKSGHYTQEWAVHVEGGEERAQRLAVDYGFEFIGKIFDDYYSFRHRKVSKRSKFPSRYYHENLAKDPNVKWLEQQVAKKRVKRYVEFNDPKWSRMWYFNRGQGLDMNVQKAWNMGYTGKGVAVTILDDGIEKEHPDLANNYDEKASYDVNGHDPDPSPRYEYTNENRHGTRCAGEVAAQANNSECSIGAAYDAKIGGVRMLDGDVTDSVEAQSLSLNPQHIQIYSASWGPDDDGRTVDGPATLATKAFYDGIARGRGGLGSIFVWASGNGGRDDDSCNCDGYTNSIYTLSISSVTENGKIPWYSEACSSTLATTYSSGSTGERQIVTTDIRRSCTETHTGTSASAPLAAGLCALALQANPMLTWRDLQHIVVMTAKPDYLEDPNWVTNGVGRKVSHSFGYGLMDAGSMVQLARNWTTVPPQHICEKRSKDENKSIPMNGKITVQLYTDGCEGTVHHVKYLEHVQARITLKASRRGEIQIYLTSPMMTTSTLLAKRREDASREGFNNWAFMTTHNWGELAKGSWQLVIENGAHSFRGARLKDWVLVLYGTDRNPHFPMTTAPPTSSTDSPTTTTQRNSRQRKHKPSGYIDNWQSRYYNTNYRTEYDNTYTFNNKKTYNRNRKKPWPRPRLRPKPTTTTTTTSTLPTTKLRPFVHRHPYYQQPRQNNRPRYGHESHMCIFETLAKKNNMSTRQYYEMIKKDLSSAELKEWSLLMMGTSSNPQMHEVTPPANSDQPFTCSGITSQGVCIECRPGFYKLNDGCVANCPEHYYGIMQMVQLRSTLNSTATRPKFQRHGICNECNEACRTCKGPQVSDCFQCSDGFERRENLCQKKLLLNFLDPDMLGFFVWVIVLCIAAIILFAVIFGLLQARDHKVLCWKEKRHKESDKGDYKGMTLTREELENDLENYDIIRNRNFRHGSVPEDHLCRVHLTEPLTSPTSTTIKSSSGTGSRSRESGGNTSQTHIEYAESNVKDYSASTFSDMHRNRTNSNISDTHRNRTNSNISDVHISRNDSSAYMHRTSSNISDKHISRNSSNISNGHMVRNNSNLSNGHVSRNNSDIVHIIRTNSNVSDVHMSRNNSNISEGHLNRTNSNISDIVLNRTNSNISDYVPCDLNPPSSYRSSSGSNHKRGSRSSGHSSGHSRHNRMSSSRH